MPKTTWTSLQEYQRAYYLKNRAKILKRTKAWKKKRSKRPAPKEEKLASRRKRWPSYAEYAKEYRATDKGIWVIYLSRMRRMPQKSTITQEAFFTLINSPCHYHGGPPSRGVDRLDSAKGYIEGNCVPCCPQCNWMKNTYSLVEFVSRCREVAQHFPTSLPASSPSALRDPGQNLPSLHTDDTPA